MTPCANANRPPKTSESLATAQHAGLRGPKNRIPPGVVPFSTPDPEQTWPQRLSPSIETTASFAASMSKRTSETVGGSSRWPRFSPRCRVGDRRGHHRGCAGAARRSDSHRHRDHDPRWRRRPGSPGAARSNSSSARTQTQDHQASPPQRSKRPPGASQLAAPLRPVRPRARWPRACRYHAASQSVEDRKVFYDSEPVHRSGPADAGTSGSEGFGERTANSPGNSAPARAVGQHHPGGQRSARAGFLDAWGQSDFPF